MNDKPNLSDVMEDDLFQSAQGETVETLQFLQHHAVPLSELQLAGLAQLHYLDNRRKAKNKPSVYGSLANFIQANGKYLSGPDVFLDAMATLTMADRVKGNVRLKDMMSGQQPGGK